MLKQYKEENVEKQNQKIKHKTKLQKKRKPKGENRFKFPISNKLI